MRSGSSVIRDVEEKDIVAGCPAKSIKYKINISKDKLFLMGGQSDKGGIEEEQKQRWERKKLSYTIYSICISK